ncbi:MAG: heat-inducible transcription repressor HrcA [Actinobacteria bacterium]|uniref:Unannotated protein n=1 Tax=freshwater metagenome TaxID=449393 RepID=A0A6J7CYT4_9ZZZZ|nr:heat-inducible transcription repressor HrcA [Actinomycetota bacterium]
MLTPRQELVLRLVAERHLDEGAPVASKTLARTLSWGPSTIRAELAGLEDLGLLDHPHTSAGRVPTEAGYRVLVDRYLSERRGGQPVFEPSDVANELDTAMREATEQLAEATELLAVVTAPPLSTSTVRHVELLPLQPHRLMVVVITSNGGVTKRMVATSSALDPGLVAWAGSFLNERLAGKGIGERMIRKRLDDPSLNPRERTILELVTPVFTELADTEEDSLFVDGASRMVEDHRLADESEISTVVAMLERRVELLTALKTALPEPDVLVRIGQENEAPQMRSMTMVAAAYGPLRKSVGTVSVLGPVRMDYARAIVAVRAASAELSHLVEDVYNTD